MAATGFYSRTCIHCGQAFRSQKKQQVVCSHSCSRQRELGSVVERFWASVERSPGCWRWVGRHQYKGYGVFKLDKVHRLAHRFAYELVIGPIPAGLEVAHRCDVRDCVRPEHLWLVTHHENIADMNAKGRRFPTYGTDNPNYRHGRYVTS